MIKRFAVFLLFALLFFMGELFAQDPEFSQFYANPLYLNPALAGVTICPKAMPTIATNGPQSEKHSSHTMPLTTSMSISCMEGLAY